MSHSLSSLRLLPSLSLSLAKLQTLVVSSISSIPTYKSGPQWLHLLSRRITTDDHLCQLLCRAATSDLRFHSPNLHIWNSLLHSLAGGPSPSLALNLFILMRSQGLAIDSYTFTSALKVTSRLSNHRAGAELHSLIAKLGFDSDTFVLNSLIHSYFACGLPSSARKVFDLAPFSARDVVSWNSLVSGYLQNELYVETLWVFWKMVENSIKMDEVTPVSALVACAKTGDLDMGRRIHSLIVRSGFDINVYLGSSLISMYAKGGAVDDAWKLFDRMSDRNAACWTAMISGYAHLNRVREAMELFREMQAANLKADDAAIASVLSSCARLGALDQGKYIHAYCDVSGIELSVLVKNALIDMYSKCGDISRALSIFHEIVNPDVFSWTAIISGLAMNGNSLGAIELFSEMEESGKIVPNEVTFLAVLSACSHGGLVEEGKYYFDRMRRVYKLLPRIEHYGCMVDLLGRATLLLEAQNFIKDMPIEPDVVIWRSLLFGCRANENIEMAEFAAKRILELEPKKCGGHVMLSNFYAVASRWTDVNRVRRRMNEWSIQKQPGCSYIEVNGVVYEFLSAVKICDLAEIIHDLLSGINRNSADS